ncbi:MAG: hypothetical protein KGL39_52260 [Patescibacteria group bacterium]|nr:hypothetical protein [Patescibacteria group bacterium]
MLLAIDPGRRSGWAWESRDGARACGSVSFPSDDDAIAGNAFRAWFSDTLADLQPSLVAVERAFMPRIRDADWTMHLVRSVHEIAQVHDVRRCELAAISVRKSIFGKARGLTDKDRVAHMTAMGWDIQDDHAADAAALVEAVKKLQAMEKAA